MELGRLTKEQLALVLKKRRKAEPDNGVNLEQTLTGDIAIDLGFCSKGDVEEALDIQKEEGSPELLKERIRQATTALNDHTETMRAVGTWAHTQCNGSSEK